MNISHLFACGLLMTLLSITTEAKPLTPAQQKSLRSLLGEELSEFLASGEKERRLENIRARIRLLRDLRLDTRAKNMRIMNDQPSARKHKPVTSKKAGSTSKSGCFGHKMDRIGTMSGMGC
ncbi:C-type natriuretic peptide [Alosa pseudoharengus]|uniref:C-type natriuretic peptide n=1 Tax=Alosa pseudoharengus TaxID=34774 RepID=UPI003F8B53B6